MLSRIFCGSWLVARPSCCWIWVFTVDQIGALGYCTEFGSALRNGPNVASEDSDWIAEFVAGSRSYSLSNRTWYLSWYMKSRNFVIAACFLPSPLNTETLSQTPSVLSSGPDLPGIGTDAQSEACSFLPSWMIGISAGEPLIIPMSPCANCFHRSVRSFVPGFGSVSPALTMPDRNCSASAFCELLIVQLPLSSW